MSFNSEYMVGCPGATKHGAAMPVFPSISRDIDSLSCKIEDLAVSKNIKKNKNISSYKEVDYTSISKPSHRKLTFRQPILEIHDIEDCGDFIMTRFDNPKVKFERERMRRITLLREQRDRDILEVTEADHAHKRKRLLIKHLRRKYQALINIERELKFTWEAESGKIDYGDFPPYWRPSEVAACKADPEQYFVIDQRARERNLMIPITSLSSSVSVSDSSNSEEMTPESDFSIADLRRIISKSLDGLETISYMIDFFWPIIDFCYRLFRCRDLLDFSMACNTLLQQFGYGMSSVFDFMKETVFEPIMIALTGLWRRDKFTAEGFYSKLEAIDNFTKSLFTQPLYIGLRGSLLTMASMKMFSKNIAYSLYGVFGKPQDLSLAGIATDFMASLKILAQYADLKWYGIPLDLSYTGPHAAAKLMEDTRNLLYFSDKLYSGLPVHGRMDRRMFIVEARNLLNISDRIMNNLAKTDPQRIILHKETLTLKNNVHNAICAMNGGRRITPFAVVITGTPGVGKSSLVDMTFQIHARMRGIKFHPSMVFHQATGQDFYEGVDEFSQIYWHLPEVGSLHPEIAKKTGDPTLNEVLTIVDPLAKSLNMAFGRKGTAFCHAEMIIIDNNNPTMNAEHTLSNPAAALRRFVFAEARVKPQYKVDGGEGLDSNKVALASDPDDLWTFEVYVRIPIDASKSTTVHYMKHTDEVNDIWAYAVLMTSLMSDHMTSQLNIKERMERVFDIEKVSQSNKTYSFSGYKNGKVLNMKDIPTHAITQPMMEGIDITYDKFGPSYVQKEPNFPDPSLDVSHVTEKAKDIRESMAIVDELCLGMDDLQAESGIRTALVRVSQSAKSMFADFKNFLKPVDNLSFVRKEDLAVGERYVDHGHGYVLPLPPEGQESVEQIKYINSRKSKPLEYSYYDIFKFHTKDFIVNDVYLRVIGFIFFLMQTTYKWLPHHNGEGLAKSEILFYSIPSMFLLIHIWSVIESGFHIFNVTSFVSVGLSYVPIMLYSFVIRSHVTNPHSIVRKTTVAWMDYSNKINEVKKKRLYSQSSNPLISDKWLMTDPKVVAALTGFAAAIMGALYWYRNKNKILPDNDYEVEAEDASMFRVVSPHNEVIGEYENRSGCGESYERVAIKDTTEVFNYRQKVNPNLPHNGDIMDLVRLVNSNVRQFYIEDGAQYKAHLLGLKGDIALINTHSLPKERNFKLYVANTGNVDLKQVFILTQVKPHMVHDMGDDLSLIKLESIAFRDVTKHIDNAIEHEPSYSGVFKQQPTVVHFDEHPTSVNSRHGPFIIEKHLRYPDPEHKGGDCGLPLIVQRDKAACIMGIHVAGANRFAFGFSAPLNQARILQGIEKLRSNSMKMPIASVGEIIAEVLEKPIPQSSFKYLYLPNLTYYGKCPGPVLSKQVSRLKRSRFHRDVPVLFKEFFHEIPETQFGVPIMTPGIYGGEYLNPYNYALNKMGRERQVLDNEIIECIIADLTDHIVFELAKRGVTSMQPLTMETAINGASYDPYIRRMNTSTSSGYGFAGNKANNLPIVFEEANKVVREPNEGLKAKLVEALRAIEKEEMFSMPIEGNLKDEPRDIENVKIGKTRVFYNPPMTSIVLTRMYLAPFYSLFTEFREIFHCGAGINIYKAADEIVKQKVAFGGQDLDGDFGSYDISMPFCIREAASAVTYRVCERLGYSDYALKAVSSILSNSMMPVLIFLKDVFMAPGIKPSGLSGTLEDNCLCTLIISMYVYYKKVPKEIGSYFDNVMGWNVGDDLSQNVKPKALEYYNNFALREIIEGEMGMTYTSSSKKKELTLSSHFTDVVYLKRKFKYSDSLQRWVAPLQIDSMSKMLEWVLPSDVLAPREQMIATITSFLWESALHLDEAQHDKLRMKISQLFTIHYNSGETYPFMTWDVIIQKMFA